METRAVKVFEKMETSVKELQEFVDKFMKETITPSFDNKKGLSPSAQQDIDILMERANALDRSFSGLHRTIKDMDQRELSVYEVATLSNKIEYALKDWQSRFVSLDSAWESVLEDSGVISRTQPIEVTDGRELVHFMIEKSGKINQILQEASFKLQIYKKLEPPVKGIINEVDKLRTRLENLAEGWEPEGRKINGYVDALLTQAGQLTEKLGLTSSNGDEASGDKMLENMSNGAEKAGPELLERQKELQEFLARSQLFKETRPTLNESVSQLNKLCDCLKEALKEWQPKNEEVRDIYRSMMEKYQKAKNVQTGEKTSSSGRFEKLNSAFEQFRLDWKSKIQSISSVLNNWSGDTRKE